jgi:hypothetical protein
MKLNCDILLSPSAFKMDLRRYSLVCQLVIFLNLADTGQASTIILVGRCRLTLLTHTAGA